ncbi:hypothetical protein BH09PLA1_BH09PLA1_01860 [soil metagenome]
MRIRLAEVRVAVIGMIASLALLSLPDRAHAIIVPGTQISFGPAFPNPYGATHMARVIQALNGDYTDALFRYDGTTLRIVAWNIDEGADWYSVGYGDEFSAATINSGQFPVLLAHDQAGPPIAIPEGLFYLGMNTGIFSEGWRNAFGWVQLKNSDGALGAVDNAMAYAEPGIYIGTTIAVPEPAMGALSLFSLISSRRRRGSGKRATHFDDESAR